VLKCSENAQKAQNKSFDGRKGTGENAKVEEKWRWMQGPLPLPGSRISSNYLKISQIISNYLEIAAIH
jgi:hypothetical protein